MSVTVIRAVARIMLRMPWTLLLLYCAVTMLLVCSDTSLSPFLWARSLGYGEAWELLADRPEVSVAPFLRAGLRGLAVLLVGLLLFDPVDRRWPVDRGEYSPPARGMDVTANRYAGIVFFITGVYLLSVPGGAVFYGALFGGTTMVLGIWLALRPCQRRSAYVLGSAARIPVEMEREVEGDPLFRAWARKVKDRFSARAGEGTTGRPGGNGPSRPFTEGRARRESASFKGSPGAGPGARGASSDSSGESSGTDGFHGRQGAGTSFRGTYQGKSSSGNGGGSRPGGPWKIEDPWAVLGIEPGTPIGKVTRKWRRLCKHYHPDLVPAGLKVETEEALKKINAAYRMIVEKQKKKG